MHLNDIRQVKLYLFGICLKGRWRIRIVLHLFYVYAATDFWIRGINGSGNFKSPESAKP